MFGRRRDDSLEERPASTAAKGAPVLLEADGFRVGGRKRLVAYRDITHIGSSRLGLAIGTPNDVVRLPLQR